MQQIMHRQTGDILYAGSFDTLRECLEQAVTERANLDYADLSQANLVNAHLDDAVIRHACFSGANLMGANLSEAVLDHGDFTNAGLQNACLCSSSLQDCVFTGAQFGATDIAGADLKRSVFSTLSAFGLNFTDAAEMAGCAFAGDIPGHCPMSCPPVVLSGLRYPVALLDRHVRIGHFLTACAGLMHPFNDKGLLCDRDILAFIRAHRDLLSGLIRHARPACYGPSLKILRPDAA